MMVKDIKEKKNLLIYAHYYYPDVASTGQLLQELAEGMLGTFNITVICVIPSYSGTIAQCYKDKAFYREVINGVSIIRVRVPEFSKSNKLSRVKNILTYFFRSIIATFKTGAQDYVFSISQPPILGGLLGTFGKWIKRAKNVYVIHDFNPEQTMAIGYLKNKIIIGTMMFLDKYSCRHADKVIVVGRDMIETLKNRFSGQRVPDHCFINNWIDNKKIFPLEPDNESVTAFKKRYGLYGKLVFMYSGNIGLYYDLENLMRVIEIFKDRSDIAFVFIGDGSTKSSLINYKSEHRIDNVIFIPYQDKDKLIYSLNAGDIHWVVNAKGIKGVSVPSKLYGVMAVSKPVLGVLEKGSEGRLILEKSGCALVSEPNDYKGVEENIRVFINKHCEGMLKKMGNSGYEYFRMNLTIESSISKYIDVIASLER